MPAFGDLSAIPGKFRWKSGMTAPITGTIAKPYSTARAEVVEIGLLLPASRADALLELSKRRRQSVAQILRDLIERALAVEADLTL